MHAYIHGNMLRILSVQNEKHLQHVVYTIQFVEFEVYIYIDITAKHPPSAGFLSPSGGAAPSAPIRETNAFGGGNRIGKINQGARGAPLMAVAIKKNGVPAAPHILGAYGAPNGFKNWTRAMRIPNMCLVLKLDYGKGVSRANGQNPVLSSTVLVYRFTLMNTFTLMQLMCLIMIGQQ